MSVKGHKFPVTRYINLGYLMYNMVIIIYLFIMVKYHPVRISLPETGKYKIARTMLAIWTTKLLYCLASIFKAGCACYLTERNS